jgi:hypothetical protein
MSCRLSPIKYHEKPLLQYSLTSNRVRGTKNVSGRLLAILQVLLWQSSVKHVHEILPVSQKVETYKSMMVLQHFAEPLQIITLK